ncbi:MAG TPA: hypothetical protein VG388_10595 [Solirubrobacteraceae bacterium]|jgi:hypothetical protein|nr:hypothetical protein [Solirubrobacteraceae bacterium]
MYKSFGALMGALAVIAVTAAAAVAAPTGAKNSFRFPATCTDGTSVRSLEFVVNSANGNGKGTQNNPRGQAIFAPAHVVGSHEIYHPTKFDLTFTFTPAGGSPQSFTNTASRKRARTPVMCTVDYTTPPDAQGNTFGLSGTVWGWIS